MSDKPLKPIGRNKKDPYNGTGYTPEIHAKLVGWFTSGHKTDVAIRAAGITVYRFRSWMRLAHDGVEPFVTLANEIDRATTRVEDVLLKTVLRGALPNEKEGTAGDPALALKLLGVLYPERYSERHNVAIAVGVDARMADLWRTLEATLPPEQLVAVARAAAALVPDAAGYAPASLPAGPVSPAPLAPSVASAESAGVPASPPKPAPGRPRGAAVPAPVRPPPSRA